MRNADKPAYGHGIPGDEKAGWLPTQEPGVTKAEFFTAAALTGLLANPKVLEICSANNGLFNPDHAAFMAQEIGIATANACEPAPKEVNNG